MTPETKHALRYGDTHLTLSITGGSRAAEISRIPLRSSSSTSSEKDIVDQALDQPVSSPRLEDIVGPGDTVCVITSDVTRPLPSRRILPSIVERLNRGGVADEDITIMFALGIHRGQSEDEHVHILGEELARRIYCVDSDPNDTEFIGLTKRGTPVHLTRRALCADHLVLLGNVEYHYFAGFSGGLKAVLPGVCGQETVSANHSMMIHREAAAGIIEGNPVRQDIDSVKDLVPVSFILNVVLDAGGSVCYAAGGDPIAAHRRACDHVDRVSRVDVDEPAHLVIAAAGGHPRDINLYQAQKALDSAQSFALPGAPILLVARCEEGYGNAVFSKWIGEARTPEEVLRRLEDSFELGGHKAAALARVVQEHPIWLASDMEPTRVREAFLRYAKPGSGGTLHLPDEVWTSMDKCRSSGQRMRIIILLDAAGVLPRFPSRTP